MTNPIDIYPDDSDTILIVDDNPMNLNVISDLLNSAGYRVLISRDGEGAIERAQISHPNLILLDVLMPGMDGFECCRRLKMIEILKEIPVIFMTALSSTEDKVKGFNVGGEDYITKPFQHEEVLVRIRTHLTLHRMQKQLENQNKALVLEIVERERAESALQEAHSELERRVEERTAELSESKRILSNLIGNLPGIVYRCRYGEEITMEFISEGCIPITGYTPADLINNAKVSYYNLISPDQYKQFLSTVANAISKNERYEYIYTVQAADGSKKWLWDHGSGVSDQKGGVIALEGYIIDITQKMKTEEKIKDAVEQLTKNMEILAVLNDQIRNPLTVIAAIAERSQDNRNNKIFEQIKKIDATIDELDHNFLASEKIRLYLQKHYLVFQNDMPGRE